MPPLKLNRIDLKKLPKKKLTAVQTNDIAPETSTACGSIRDALSTLDTNKETPLSITDMLRRQLNTRRALRDMQSSLDFQMHETIQSLRKSNVL